MFISAPRKAASFVCATFIVVATVVGPGAAVAAPVPVVAGIACDAAELAPSICFDKRGNVGAVAIITHASSTDLARCETWFTPRHATRAASCAAAGGVLVLAGRVIQHVSQQRLEAIGSRGLCIGRPMGPTKLDPPVACFIGGDLLVAGKSGEVAP